MALDINPLLNAITRLKEGLNDYRRNTIRDGLIQRFEFTYEIVHKMLKRHLESISPTSGENDSMPFQDLICSGNEQGLLLGDWPKWRGYRDMRSKTSHAHDEEIALEVVVNIPSFLDETRYFRDKPIQRLNR
jgi:nucleotidyltransferase substrate binding protein (TIGR01987 family)